MFEPAYEAEPVLQKIESQQGSFSQKFLVDFVFKRKRGSAAGIEEENSLFDYVQLNKKYFSKGKKIILVLCLVLALNSIEPVR